MGSSRPTVAALLPFSHVRCATRRGIAEESTPGGALSLSQAHVHLCLGFSVAKRCSVTFKKKYTGIRFPLVFLLMAMIIDVIASVCPVRLRDLRCGPSLATYETFILRLDRIPRLPIYAHTTCWRTLVRAAALLIGTSSLPHWSLAIGRTLLRWKNKWLNKQTHGNYVSGTQRSCRNHILAASTTSGRHYTTAESSKLYCGT